MDPNAAHDRSATLGSTVSIDAVQLKATAPSAPPTLYVKGYVGSAFGSLCQLQWSEPAFGFVLQSATGFNGTWTDVPNVQVSRKDGRLAADVPTSPSASQVYFRLRASP